MREKHPMAGSPVEVTKGPHKGKYFIVIDWLQNQYQGKSMEKIYEGHGALMHDVVRRHGLDNKIVFGKLYPTQAFACVHDTEIQTLTTSKPPELTIITGGKDDSGTATASSDSGAASSGGQESEGRSVSSAAHVPEDAGGDSTETKADRPAGSKGRKSKKTTE